MGIKWRVTFPFYHFSFSVPPSFFSTSNHCKSLLAPAFPLFPFSRYPIPREGVANKGRKRNRDPTTMANLQKYRERLLFRLLVSHTQYANNIFFLPRKNGKLTLLQLFSILEKSPEKLRLLFLQQHALNLTIAILMGQLISIWPPSLAHILHVTPPGVANVQPSQSFLRSTTSPPHPRILLFY